MVANDTLMGAFTIYRQRVRPFSDDTLTLAQMFAHQSVIAIKNARMIGALRAAANVLDAD
ncbi:MAG: GAF domain-containing protein [Paracoccaceae bacterium]|jgi:GAF domain-containing protein